MRNGDADGDPRLCLPGKLVVGMLPVRTAGARFSPARPVAPDAARAAR